MFTVCPKCALTLVVTAADLRVAQGYVRCGRCSSVFNALAQLSDDRSAARSVEAAPPEPEPEEPAAGAAEPPAAPHGAGDEEAASEDALEFNPETTDAASVFVAAQPDPQWTAATGSFKARVAAKEEPGAPAGGSEAQGAGDFNVELDAALLSDIVQSFPAKSAGATAARREAAASAPSEEPIPAANEAAADEFASLGPPVAPQRARSPFLWAVGVMLLVLVLAAQIIDHRRDALATDPRFNGPLTALYASLGIRLTPRWDLHAYDVRQLGATVDQGNRGAITVRASIRNAGAKPQPLPLLRVTLQDRFGNRLASRDVEPRDYLPRSIPPTSLLAPDQRVDADLAFVDPGASAVGFELDACLPLAGGGVACANDASAR